MSDHEGKARSREDAELEREVRSRREFSLDEAIGRAAGDLMKGASPVTRKRQAELEIEEALERHLTDSEGALLVVLRRRVLESEALLAEGYERPLAALVRVGERLLGSQERLRRLVREVDAEWGRMYSERPRFEAADGTVEAGDPYTVESVRAVLSGLLDGLRPEAG
jgi:hypothetical protein